VLIAGRQYYQRLSVFARMIIARCRAKGVAILSYVLIKNVSKGLASFQGFTSLALGRLGNNNTQIPCKNVLQDPR
jgi:hypothetical protein